MIQPSLATMQALIGGNDGGAMEIVSKIFSNWTSALYFVVAGRSISICIVCLFCFLSYINSNKLNIMFLTCVRVCPFSTV